MVGARKDNKGRVLLKVKVTERKTKDISSSILTQWEGQNTFIPKIYYLEKTRRGINEE